LCPKIASPRRCRKYFNNGEMADRGGEKPTKMGQLAVGVRNGCAIVWGL